MESPISPGNFVDPASILPQFGISEGMSIADFGSGSGHFGILMAQKVGKDGHVYAFDILESAIEAIRGRASALNLANLEVRRANLEVLGATGLADGSQDLVLMANVLFQNQKKAEIVREAGRILKSGGRLVIVDWVKGAGGFGPPDELRTEENMMEQIIVSQGFIMQTKGLVGTFHHLMIFTKN